MKMRWVLLTLVFAALGAMTKAQVPDGGIGIRLSLNSQAIHSLSGTFTFVPCPGAPGSETRTDCNLFGTSTQAIFAGQNETSKVWHTLDLVFLGYDPAADPTLNCFGNTLFSNCTISPGSDCAAHPMNCSLNVDFSQGTGTGILRPCPEDDEECNSNRNHFAVGIGGSDTLNFNHPLDLTASFRANAVPEPQTLLLVGIAILGMVFLASKKKVLAYR
jgi:hypothetical protein